ncbi:HAD family hydrolase [Catellatospora tritici]|uniref:HAD family hydrolase n=1 Tax=Catellatospora tritici TaxID=2851566 RepID=UPI001C2DD0D6|nr:HAD family hydrolase [Catellatospora tritici]MBV1855351.1 HAD family hydrolase [Catellatospora tritici]
MITTVAFDADDTLVDIVTGVNAGLAAVVAAVGEPSLSVAGFRVDADDCWRRMADQPARLIRETALRITLDRIGRADETARLLDLFFEVRFANSRPFPGVLDTLAKLRSEYQLGYGTNANSEAARCGLGGLFAFEIYALRDGVPKKPAAGFFEALLAAAQAGPDEVVYVGDSYDHDVVGAAGAGLRTVWLNRADAPVPGPVRPDAIVADLAQLPAVIAQLKA